VEVFKYFEETNSENNKIPNNHPCAQADLPAALRKTKNQNRFLFFVIMPNKCAYPNV
jgi:hypothetical protein